MRPARGPNRPSGPNDTSVGRNITTNARPNLRMSRFFSKTQIFSIVPFSGCLCYFFCYMILKLFYMTLAVFCLWLCSFLHLFDCSFFHDFACFSFWLFLWFCSSVSWLISLYDVDLFYLILVLAHTILVIFIWSCCVFYVSLIDLYDFNESL